MSRDFVSCTAVLISADASGRSLPPYEGLFEALKREELSAVAERAICVTERLCHDLKNSWKDKEKTGDDRAMSNHLTPKKILKVNKNQQVISFQLALNYALFFTGTSNRIPSLVMHWLTFSNASKIMTLFLSAIISILVSTWIVYGHKYSFRVWNVYKYWSCFDHYLELSNHYQCIEEHPKDFGKWFYPVW